MKSNPAGIVRWVVAVVAIVVLVGACGGDDDSSTTTAGVTTTIAAPATTASAATGTTVAGSSAAPSSDVCADRNELASSVEALQDVDVAAEGTNGVEAAIADVKDDLDALRTSAGAELQPQVEAVQDAVDTLETAVDDFDSNGARGGPDRGVEPGGSGRHLARLAGFRSVWLTVLRAPAPCAAHRSPQIGGDTISCSLCDDGRRSPLDDRPVCGEWETPHRFLGRLRIDASMPNTSRDAGHGAGDGVVMDLHGRLDRGISQEVDA